MISLNKRITATTRTRRLDAEDLIKGIRDIGYQINLKNNIPLIKDLKIE